MGREWWSDGERKNEGVTEREGSSDGRGKGGCEVGREGWDDGEEKNEGAMERKG